MGAKKLIALFLALCILALCGCGAASPADAAQKAMDALGARNVDAPEHWLALCLSAADYTGVPEDWRQRYADGVKRQLSENGGLLPDAQATGYAAAVLGLTAAGYDASDFEGCDLTAPLSDVDAVTKQGVNGAVYALLALDCGGYDSGARPALLEYVLARQLADGGFAFNGDHADADVTAMALQALAAYTEQPEAAAAADAALARLSALQLADGGFESWGAVNSESCAQVLLALCQLGLGPQDARFVKNGRTVTDRLLRYQLADGTFSHTGDGASDPAATVQALCALTALRRFEAQGRGLFAPPEAALTCTLTVRCDTLLDKLPQLPQASRALVPQDGTVLACTTVPFSPGETVLDVTRRALQEENIQFEFQGATISSSGYMEGIANLYQYDCGELSGWMFAVNDAFPGLSSAQYALADGDAVQWLYTCELGGDIGNDYNGD